jgi:carbamate kinase
VPESPLDVPGAETQGMIGYLVERELGNRLPFQKPLASLLTMIEVDLDDPAFTDPSKPIGPLYTKSEADKLAAERGWTFKPDGDHMRRVVPAPVPKRIFERRPIQWLLERGCVVICAGGGGIPVAYRPGRELVGVEAVIDKDRASALLARDIDADILIMATDASAVFIGFGTQGDGRVRLREDDGKARGDRRAARHRRHARRHGGHPRRDQRHRRRIRYAWLNPTL